MRLGSRPIVAVAMIWVSAIVVAACGSPTPPAGPGAAPVADAPGGQVHGGPPPPPAPLRDGERFLEIGLTQAYQPAPPPGGTDEYRCFLVDPKITEPAFLTGSQFLPQNGEIVHHAIMYKIAPSEVEHAKSVDAAVPGDGWTCFGGTGLSNGFGGEQEGYVGGWAPGSKETLLGGIAGYPVQPGSEIVLQVHYNLLATGGKPGPRDQSTVRLRLMPGTANVTPLSALRLPVPIELPCTPQESGPLCDRTRAIEDLVARTGPQARATVLGLNSRCNGGGQPTPGPTQHCDTKVLQAADVYSVGPHMHLLGRSLTVELNPGTPNARMLLDQPNFNFDDQTSVPLAVPVSISPGDTIRMTCTHDASLRSQLPELKPLQPRYVVWGDGTSDEMCLATLVTSTKA
jgi:Copper type II ascorbate-dependent monooxygenase, C-terminal domain